MANYNNPKDYYNRPRKNDDKSEFHGYPNDRPDSSSTNSSSSLLHKSDQPLPNIPPPPYSPSVGESSTVYPPLPSDLSAPSSPYSSASAPFAPPDISGYGGTNAGLLSPSAPPLRHLSGAGPPSHNPHISPRSIMDPSLRITVDTNSGRCCKSWCKFLVLGLLVWFILIKSIGLFGDDGVGNNYLCNQEITRVWNGMPARLPVIKDIAIIIKSPVTEGTINIKMLPAGTQGYIEHTIQSTSDVMDGIDYSYISGSTSALGITFPKRGDGRTCAYIDLNVYLPVETDSVYIQVDSMRIRMEDEMNIDNISLQTANAGIRLFKKWTGKNLSIRSTNSNIVTDAIIAENQIDITTTNGKIQVTDAVALNKILLTSSNGGLYGLSLDSRIIQLKTTNGNIDYNMITADNVIIETSNAQINVIAKSNNVFLMTTNGKVTAKVNSHNKPKVSVTTSNAPAHLYLPNFTGVFHTSTTSGYATISDSVPNAISYSINQKNKIVGTRLHGNGSIILKTSNNNSELIFGV